jgi:uncharacterized protein (TIGR02266 family)
MQGSSQLWWPRSIVSEKRRNTVQITAVDPTSRLYRDRNGEGNERYRAGDGVPIDRVMAAASKMVVKTVVIADDTEFVRTRFKTAIEQAGHRAVGARTGAELVSLVSDHVPPIDLVVMDLRLPDKRRGIELVRAVREMGRHRPLVVFSGTIAGTHEVKALASLGVNGYINEYTGPQHIVPALSPHLFPDGNNRRASPRATLSVAVSYRVANTIATGLTLNVSTGGVAIRTTSPLEIGTALKVRFRLPKGKHEIDADARVAWADHRVGMGLQFTRIDAGDQATVEAYVSAHFFSNRKA